MISAWPGCSFKTKSTAEVIGVKKKKKLKKITHGLAVGVAHRETQPKPTCVRNSKMTIKLTDKVHVPYILHLPLGRARRRGGGGGHGAGLGFTWCYREDWASAFCH